MKKLTCAAALSLSLVSTASAGSLSDPVVEPDVIVADSGSSSSGTVMGILLLSLLAILIDSH